MKIILALLLAFACFASVQSTYTPEWEECGGSLTWDSVTLSEAPVAGKNTTVRICGTNPAQYSILFFEKVNVVSGTLFDYTFNQTAQVNGGKSNCWDVNFKIPKEAPQTLVTQIDVRGRLMKINACVSVTLELADKLKFLGF